MSKSRYYDVSLKVKDTELQDVLDSVMWADNGMRREDVSVEYVSEVSSDD